MKKTILLLILVLLLVAVAIVVGAMPEKDHRPYKDSPYAASIDAGLAFLEKRAASDEREWQVYAILDFLQRRFQLSPRYRFDALIPVEDWTGDEAEAAHYFRRLLHPDATLDCKAIDALAGQGQIEEFYFYMLHALYCKSCTFRDDFYENLYAFYKGETRESGSPGYAETHAIVSFMWLHELGCEDDQLNLESLRDEFAQVLFFIVEGEQAGTDLAFEAMAFLSYIGAGDRMRPNWLETMTNHQLLSGGWPWDPGKPAAGHPTVLALWALLEAALPDQPQIPWIALP